MLGDVQDMLVFAEVARAGSLTRAGVRLGLPKSTVSRRLAALEERLGTRLLERSTRKLVLTEAGEAFLERCQRLSDDVDDALALASELSDEPRGTLRVSLVPDLGPLLLAEPIARFHARYPRLSLEIDESPRYVDLAAERFDLALRAGHLADSSLVARKLLTMHAGVFATPRYLERHPAPEAPADLAAHRFVVLAGRTRFDRATLRGPGEAVRDVSLPHTVVATTSGMQRALALQGVGALVYPICLCAEEVADGRLVRLVPSWRVETPPLWLVTPSRRLLPRKTVLFIEHLLRELGDDK
ncbi:MAG: LysR family transcriptional regulator [Polyangiales bacterium]